MSCEQLKVGFIACSSIAKRRFLPAVANMACLRIWSIGSRDIPKAKNFAEQFGSPYFGTYEDVLNDKSIDIIYISTPPHNHFELTAKALNAGKHVICEKPITNNLINLIKLNEIAVRNRVIFAEHYSFLHHKQHTLVQNLIKKGEIGKILGISGQYFYPMPDVSDIRLNSDILGGVIHDSLGYPISAGLFFIKENAVKISSSVTVNKKTNIDHYCSFNIDYEGTNLYGEVGMGREYQSSYQIRGETGEIVVHRAYSVDSNHHAIVSLKNKDMSYEYSVPKSNQIENFLKSFIANLKDNFSDNQYINHFYYDSYRLRLIQDEVVKNAKRSYV